MTLPITVDRPDIEAVYEDVGEHGPTVACRLKALTRCAKRAAVAEPERGRGQGEAAEQPAEEPASEPTQPRSENGGENGTQPREHDHAQGNGVVVVDFGGNDPEAA